MYRMIMICYGIFLKQEISPGFQFIELSITVYRISVHQSKVDRFLLFSCIYFKIFKLAQHNQICNFSLFFSFSAGNLIRMFAVFQ